MQFCILIEIFIINEVFCINGKRRRIKVCCFTFSWNNTLVALQKFSFIIRIVTCGYAQYTHSQIQPSGKQHNVEVIATSDCLLQLYIIIILQENRVSIIILQVRWVGRTSYFTLLYTIMLCTRLL